MAELSSVCTFWWDHMFAKILNQYWEIWIGLLTAFSPFTCTICIIHVKWSCLRPVLYSKRLTLMLRISFALFINNFSIFPSWTAVSSCCVFPALHPITPNHPLLMARHNLEVGSITSSRAQRANRQRRYQYLQLNSRNPNPPVILQRYVVVLLESELLGWYVLSAVWQWFNLVLLQVVGPSCSWPASISKSGTGFNLPWYKGGCHG
jgi:hypothetical protein